ncbi:ABC transporter ATP-binding protein YojI [Pseudoalteromonas sp. P1-9]|uniref:cyclic peptide export ABC transporter n=1 Tax=Pseudoalteromonas sp. P1-9 TaxID=1710354 RepID=UPI0006D63C3D|nr:cyclic peptide export ABC transporter [Pseudoalteromonas sp. P1-9]KPV93760.1 ABC transporter ATP-binding protein YojI [Pseudoalteromonas sp. P1-9]
MKLFSAFTKTAPNKVFLSVILGGLSGVCYSLLIPIVLQAVNQSHGFLKTDSSLHTFLGYEISHYKVATLFLFTCIFILISRTCSQLILARISLDLTSKIRRDFYDKIAKAPISSLENIGYAKLIATISGDVGRIVGGASILPDILINSVTLFGMLGFLLYLNADVFWFVIMAILFGVITYQIPMYFGNKYFYKARMKYDSLHTAIQGLVFGAKELKLNKNKKDKFFKDILLESERGVISAEKNGISITRAAANYGDLLSFFVIGVVIFVFVNYHSVSNGELLGVIMALLYITTPVSIIINSIPSIIMAKVALNKVKTVFDELSIEEFSTEIFDVNWNSIKFKGVEYSYGGGTSGRAFSLGPVDLEIKRGQVTFIVGGNGSGKSTLSKVISLHYQATGGKIYFEDELITADNTNAYRQTVSAIFSDYHLFDRLLDIRQENVNELIEDYLKQLALKEKVTITDGEFSTLSLSDGQRRRMALLVSFLEDKDLYLFDEWAADQDPSFKHFFYHQVLPDLKAKGKAVVVISHDDRFFDVADEIVIMEDGKRVEEYGGFMGISKAS